jgi:hypothetical protein
MKVSLEFKMRKKSGTYMLDAKPLGIISSLGTHIQGLCKQTLFPCLFFFFLSLLVCFVMLLFCLFCEHGRQVLYHTAVSLSLRSALKYSKT